MDGRPARFLYLNCSDEPLFYRRELGRLADTTPLHHAHGPPMRLIDVEIALGNFDVQIKRSFN